MVRLFTSESVTEGHPDKLCDQISDAILDALLEQDPMSRVACETFATTGMIHVMGEITTRAHVDIPAIVRKTALDIGYNSSDVCFDGNTCGVSVAIHAQSPDIAMGVDAALEKRDGESGQESDEIGAGDQGMMFGYACDETPEYMPMPIALSHRLARKLAEVRKTGVLPYLCPDGKTQVTIRYEDDVPVAVDTIVISTQHTADTDMDVLKKDLREKVIDAVIPTELMSDDTKIFINPTGRFVIGGPAGDTGLTGRKIIVDTYGGYAPHGGGAFSGKDPTKVDRSAAYAVRHVAKNVVAAGLAKKCEVQVAYAIGVARPVSLLVDTKGTGVLPDDVLSRIVSEIFDLRPQAIIQELNMRRPIYKQTAAYGHFGRNDLDLPWEKLDKVDALKAAAAKASV